jgi:hypothetical protein
VRQPFRLHLQQKLAFFSVSYAKSVEMSAANCLCVATCLSGQRGEPGMCLRGQKVEPGMYLSGQRGSQTCASADRGGSQACASADRWGSQACASADRGGNHACASADRWGAMCVPKGTRGGARHVPHASTNCMKPNPQGLDSSLWNSQVQHLASALSQTNPYFPTPSLRSILIYPPTYVLVLLLATFLLAFAPVTYMHSSSPHSCYRPVQLIHLYNSWHSSSLCR